MSRKKQPHLPGFESLGIKEFGGIHLKGNARTQRPISTKRPMHLVMRSSLAKGDRSFLRRAAKIRGIVYATGHTQEVQILRFANAGNHLHLIVLAKSRAAFQRFIRAISGLIARTTLGVERGSAKGLKFWDALPFTRILEWGRDLRQACAYVVQNTLEAIGFVAYEEREARGKLKVPG
jgi:hypothetical protein